MQGIFHVSILHLQVVQFRPLWDSAFVAIAKLEGDVAEFRIGLQFGLVLFEGNDYSVLEEAADSCETKKKMAFRSSTPGRFL